MIDIAMDIARYLAQNYLAQALCSLGRYEEAYEILDIQLTIPPPETFNLNADERPGNHTKGYSWGIDDIGAAHIRPELMAEVLRNTNRAVVWALLGKLTDAQIILQSILSECPSFPPAIRCLVYTLLRMGKKQEASVLLVDMNISPVSFSSSGLKK
jgi:tetratricopeptide (TPR) repeat protein